MMKVQDKLWIIQTLLYCSTVINSLEQLVYLATT